MDEIAANRYPALDWKQDLRVSQRLFAEHEGFGEGTASVCIAVERYLMRSALAFRKLLVQRVLTDEVINADWRVLTYPCTKAPDERWWFEGTVDMENLHHFVRHYDLGRPRKESLRLQRLADFLIHSFVFAVWPKDGGSYEQARFFFNSDRNRGKLVYEMQVTDFKAIVEEVLDDEVVYVSIDKSTGEFHQHNLAWKHRQREGRGRPDLSEGMNGGR
jgi:hypothetical protein